jgi:hypothetical protein
VDVAGFAAALGVAGLAGVCARAATAVAAKKIIKKNCFIAKEGSDLFLSGV